MKVHILDEVFVGVFFWMAGRWLMFSAIVIDWVLFRETGDASGWRMVCCRERLAELMGRVASGFDA